jgi:hypothetical protein
MADLWVVLGVLAFFGVCLALIRGCDLIIGPDDDAELDEEPETSEVEDLTVRGGVR